jgi:hypothetical protein
VYDAVDDGCHDTRVKFIDNADADGAYVERRNALSAHPSSERHSGNSVIFSAEVYKHCEGFSDRHVLLDMCAGESVFKNRNLFILSNRHPHP